MPFKMNLILWKQRSSIVYTDTNKRVRKQRKSPFGDFDSLTILKYSPLKAISITTKKALY